MSKPRGTARLPGKPDERHKFPASLSKHAAEGSCAGDAEKGLPSLLPKPSVSPLPCEADSEGVYVLLGLFSSFSCRFSKKDILIQIYSKSFWAELHRLQCNSSSKTGRLI